LLPLQRHGTAFNGISSELTHSKPQECPTALSQGGHEGLQNAYPKLVFALVPSVRVRLSQVISNGFQQSFTLFAFYGRFVAHPKNVV
jgi:hypothetical protein